MEISSDDWLTVTAVTVMVVTGLTVTVVTDLL